MPTTTKTPPALILIGMPGAGKSSVGAVLAKLTLRDFVDTDVLIQIVHKRTLQDIVDRDGYEALRKAEEDVLLGLSVTNSVIATGGSAVYSDAAMAHLKSCGLVIFLDVELPMLESRIHDYSTRGLANRPDQDLSDLFRERSALYAKYADITIKDSGLNQEQVCAIIIDRVREYTLH